MRIASVSLASLLLAHAAPAFADEPVLDGPFPTTATLDRTTDHSDVNTSLGLSFYGEDGPDVGARIDLHGQYVALGGFGGYVPVPISYLSGNDDSQTEVGNLELGGLYVANAAPTTDIVLSGGLVLPTGPDDLDALVNVAAMVPRMTDLTSVSNEVTWLRLKASPLHRAGNLFVRADVGVDLAIDKPEDADVDPLVRLNVAVGAQVGTATIAGELVTIGTTGDVGDEDRFLHTVAVSGSVATGGVRPYGALVVPVDNDFASDFLDVNFALIAGLEVPLGATGPSVQ